MKDLRFEWKYFLYNHKFYLIKFCKLAVLYFTKCEIFYRVTGLPQPHPSALRGYPLSSDKARRPNLVTVYYSPFSHASAEGKRKRWVPCAHSHEKKPQQTLIQQKSLGPYLPSLHVGGTCLMTSSQMNKEFLIWNQRWPTRLWKIKHFITWLRT